MSEFISALAREGLETALTRVHYLWLVSMLAGSLTVLAYGANYMVDGAVHLARRTGMRRVLIGATVVAIGTSLPEMFVSTIAAWKGNPGLALGNGVGSVLCDTGLIFGLTCFLSPLPNNKFVLNRTGWVQVISATMLVALALIIKAVTPGTPYLPRVVGFIFLGLLCFYLYLSVGWAKQGGMDDGEVGDLPLMPLGKSLFLFSAGLAGILISCSILVPVAAEIAMRLGVPDDVIAATLVAFGTSLPELTTALVCVKKGYPSIILGTIVGSDVLNILFVIGAAAAARPLAIPDNFYLFHFPAMLAVLYLFRGFIFMNKGGSFKRWQGGSILGVYFLYLILQFGFNLG
ncbi:MAG: sodium:calcium antiporter [Desulfatibacillum sp.]|nr:sodium:calcium antiporter [Desulfatibacillum sp.]